MKNNNYICTVLLISYNHRNYIRKAIKSAVNQKTNYKYKIHIFDDGSTDGTVDIINEYTERYPDLIVPFVSKQNRGVQQNIWEAYKSVDTKYCAFLECDDFWCDEEKLQLQIDALEKHAECSFCAHNTIYINKNDRYREKEDGKIFVYNRNVRETGIYTSDDFVNLYGAGWMHHNNSRVIRMDCIDLDSLEDKEDFLYDNSQFFYLLNRGKLYFIQRIMSAYVLNMSGSFTSQSVQNKIEGHWSRLLHINKMTEKRYEKLIYRHLASFATYWLYLQDVHDGERKEHGDLAFYFIRLFNKLRYDLFYNYKLKCNVKKNYKKLMED